MAHFSDIESIGEDFAGVIFEAVLHFLWGFQEELVIIVFFSILVGRFFLGSNAKKDIVGFGIILIEVMDVVGSNERDVEFFREFEQFLIHLFLGGDTVVLEFEEERIFSKHFLEFVDCIVDYFCFLAIEDHLRDFTAEASGEANESLAMFFESLFIDSGFIIESFSIGDGCEFRDIAIALDIFCEDNEVVVVFF